jgi:hypothetical protein
VRKQIAEKLIPAIEVEAADLVETYIRGVTTPAPQPRRTCAADGGRYRSKGSKAQI